MVETPKEAISNTHTHHTHTENSARSPLLSSPFAPCWRNLSTEVTAHTRGCEPRRHSMPPASFPGPCGTSGTLVTQACTMRAQDAHTCMAHMHTHQKSIQLSDNAAQGHMHALCLPSSLRTHPLTCTVPYVPTCMSPPTSVHHMLTFSLQPPHTPIYLKVRSQQLFLHNSSQSAIASSLHVPQAT